MNPLLNRLQPYPFEKLRQLLKNVIPSPKYSEINLTIGEPKHPVPECVEQTIIQHLADLSPYPSNQGHPELRQAICYWLKKRYHLKSIHPDQQVLVCNGTREALFSFAQVAIDPSKPAVVLSPNPFYQIYEGAAFLSGAEIVYYNADPAQEFAAKWSDIPEETWQNTQLVYTCSPGNPTGNVMTLAEWRFLFEKADQYNFVIAADECYSEIYTNTPPLGALEAAEQLGRNDFKNLLIFSSLSKRSNVPGLRSGFVAGDTEWISAFLRYRTYHGATLSNVFAAASTAAWQDETHVQANQALYREKFAAVVPILAQVMDIRSPDGSFYLWAPTPYCDQQFTQDLLSERHVRVVPGSYLAREAWGINPGSQRIRIALVSDLSSCTEAAERIVDFIRHS